MSSHFRRMARAVAVLLGVGLAAAATPAVAAAASENYGEYSLMFRNSAGQLFDSDGRAASQWAWRPTGDRTSEVRWAVPADWNKPATGVEHFVRDGDWVHLDGFENKDTGTFYAQRVTSELIGDGNCANMAPLASNNGLQHYARWTIPTTAYCTIAKGTITSSKGGKATNFEHKQIWRPATTCTTRYQGNVRCIEQFETWADDNGHPWAVQIERTHRFGKGLGPGLSIHSTIGGGKPINWTADLRYTWTW